MIKIKEFYLSFKQNNSRKLVLVQTIVNTMFNIKGSFKNKIFIQNKTMKHGIPLFIILILEISIFERKN